MEPLWALSLLVLGWVPMLLGIGWPRRADSLRPEEPPPLPERRGAEPLPETGEFPPPVERLGRADDDRDASRAGERSLPESRDAPRAGLGRRGPEGRRVSRFDRMLLLLTWCACAALTASALWAARTRPEPQRLAWGVALFWIGVGLWLWGRAVAGAHFAQVARVPAVLETRGPYRLTRHPLYVATSIACLGQALAGGSPWSFGLWIAVVLVFSVRARREERLLRAAFGARWTAYAQRTPRILP